MPTKIGCLKSVTEKNMFSIAKHFNLFFSKVRQIGFTPSMDDYKKRRLGIFNLINFFGLTTGLTIPIAGFFGNGYLPVIAWVVAFSPFVISSVVLISNYYKKYYFAMMWYFILYPTITSLVYVGGIDVGIELFFILYGVLAVFFLQKIIINEFSHTSFSTFSGKNNIYFFFYFIYCIFRTS